MPLPIAIWNSARDAWEVPGTANLFCGHSDAYLGTFPTSGSTVNGAAYALPTSGLPTEDSGSSSLLPTVTTQDGANNGGPSQFRRQTIPLNTRVLMLPTPDAYAGTRGGARDPEERRAGGHSITLADRVTHLLPTTTASDANGGGQSGPNRQGTGGLRAVDQLLPTPVTTDAFGARNRTAKRGPEAKKAHAGETITDVIWVQNGWEPGDTGPPWEKSPGVSTGPRSGGGNQLWEDVPLPLLIPPDETAGSGFPLDSRNG